MPSWPGAPIQNRPHVGPVGQKFLPWNLLSLTSVVGAGQRCRPGTATPSQTMSIPGGSHSPFLFFEELFNPLSYPHPSLTHVWGWPDALRYSRTHIMEPHSQLWFQEDSQARTSLLLSDTVVLSPFVQDWAAKIVLLGCWFWWFSLTLEPGWV